MERHFLVVASDSKVREGLAAALRKQGGTVTLADGAAQAVRVVESVTVQTALIESHLPDGSGAELRERLLRLRPDCRVVLLTSFRLVRNTPEVLRFGPDDYLVHADQVFDLLQPRQEADPAAGSWGEPASHALLRVIDVLVGLLEVEDERFGNTSHVAAELARATAEEMGAGEEMLYEVVLGTLLRDIGDAGGEAESEAGLSDDARKEQVTKHVTASLRLLEHVDFPWKVLPVIRHHHERYNGSGAPDGLRGREIPMAARIVAVVDAYVCRTTGKHEEAVSPEEALAELARRTGHEFDPEVVEAFHRVIDKRVTGRRSRGKPQVVLVDHDLQFRRVLKVRLGNVGLKVREAPDFERFKEQLLKEPPDLALVGIDADPKDAFQILSEIQQDASLCRIPLAFLSSRNDRPLKIRALRMGVDDFLSKNDNMEELVARVENILIRGALRAEGEARRTRRGITGSLENLSLPDIVQTLTIGMKTACVTLTADNRTGHIWFDNGTPTHAECGSLDGEAAFYEMVRWPDGEFVIEHGAKAHRTTVERDAMYLLMEGLRLIDEDRGAARTAS